MSVYTASVHKQVAHDQVAPRVLRTALAFAISLFFIWGLAYGLLDVLNKHFQDTLHVGTAQSTWLQIAYFGAYLLVSLPAGLLLQRVGYKVGILIGLMVTALGALLFIPSASLGQFLPFVLSMFVLASGLACLETAADSYVNVLGSPELASRRLNLAQSFNGLGTFIGPLIGGSLFFKGTAAGEGAHDNVQLIYAIIGVAIAVFALVVGRAHLPEIAEPEHASDGADGRPLYQHRHFVLGVLTQAIYIGAQVGCGALFVNVAIDTWAGLDAQGAAYLLSLALVLFMAGRFVATALLGRISPRVLLTLFAVINVALSLVVAAGLDRVSLIAMIAVFFFMSTMFPTIFALGVQGLGPNTKRGASMMVMAIGGGVVLPYPMGLIAEAYGFPAAYILPALGFVVVALYGARGARYSA
ncbi:MULTISPECIES: sugar MFS transporter [Nitrospirillum]|uniref:FHS family L-fucose permease-like MFS transporter n=1 Tax=Nitrospirillum amazonense TaxID=28077 RepID=A0A560JCH2_9PROT|nr:sugar MFS transporter [Nitrospirillum amazonense]TWB18369.1 FHS family L-fucose permease-like MFS transporter [Nitrospirillum amazonense]TWB25704.1 FHS family L-fucose permease-like MFS transporter [Nitrospirillum amazonense]TWB66110.1 FHS family L-fucose permease-like MFS transporter [Nitrospirillum amazonense]